MGFTGEIQARYAKEQAQVYGEIWARHVRRQLSTLGFYEVQACSRHIMNLPTPLMRSVQKVLEKPEAELMAKLKAINALQPAFRLIESGANPEARIKDYGKDTAFVFKFDFDDPTLDYRSSYFTLPCKWTFECLDTSAYTGRPDPFFIICLLLKLHQWENMYKIFAPVIEKAPEPVILAADPDAPVIVPPDLTGQPKHVKLPASTAKPKLKKIPAPRKPKTLEVKDILRQIFSAIGQFNADQEEAKPATPKKPVKKKQVPPKTTAEKEKTEKMKASPFAALLNADEPQIDPNAPPPPMKRILSATMIDKGVMNITKVVGRGFGFKCKTVDVILKKVDPTSPDEVCLEGCSVNWTVNGNDNPRVLAGLRMRDFMRKHNVQAGTEATVTAAIGKLTIEF